MKPTFYLFKHIYRGISEKSLQTDWHTHIHTHTHTHAHMHTHTHAHTHTQTFTFITRTKSLSAWKKNMLKNMLIKDIYDRITCFFI